MTTYTAPNLEYSIDRIEGGMTFEFGCNFPCKTCLSSDPNYCTECNIIDTFLILY